MVMWLMLLLYLFTYLLFTSHSVSHLNYFRIPLITQLLHVIIHITILTLYSYTIYYRRLVHLLFGSFVWHFPSVGRSLYSSHYLLFRNSHFWVVSRRSQGDSVIFRRLPFGDRMTMSVCHHSAQEEKIEATIGKWGQTVLGGLYTRLASGP